MKKKEKTVCQIIRFRGKIEAFLVSIDEFAISSDNPQVRMWKILYTNNNDFHHPRLCAAAHC